MNLGDYVGGPIQQGRNAQFGVALGAKPSAPVERVAEVIEASGKLAARVTALVDRIAGAGACGQTASVAQIGQSGVLGGLVTSADEAQAQIASANDALDRLARAFGL